MANFFSKNLLVASFAVLLVCDFFIFAPLVKAGDNDINLNGYSNNALISNNDSDVYVVVDGHAWKVTTMAQYIKYTKQTVNKVSTVTLNSYLGVNTLDIKDYVDGTLIRVVGSPRTYVMLDGQAVYIKTLAELAEYNGRQMVIINNNGSEKLIVSPKAYANGTLIQVVGSDNIYVIKDGLRFHVATQTELDQYKGQEIFLVTE